MLTVFSFAITWIRSHIASERGQDLIEYAMLSGLIAAAMAGIGFAAYSGALTSLADGISRCVDFKASTPCG